MRKLNFFVHPTPSLKPIGSSILPYNLSSQEKVQLLRTVDGLQGRLGINITCVQSDGEICI
jgi:hypothetical protein